MKIAIIGLGYVGIQLATGLGRQYATMGFDLDAAKVAAYEAGEDPTGEVSNSQLEMQYTLVSQPNRVICAVMMFI